jgi:predicted metal-dependent phosphoesterase TrpH
MAYEKEIEIIALTDHDTFGGVGDFLKPITKIGITGVPAIEDQVLRGGNVGCELLTEGLQVIKLRVSLFGHLHEVRRYIEKNN